LHRSLSSLSQDISDSTPNSFEAFRGSCVGAFGTALFNELSDTAVFSFSSDGISGFSSAVFTLLWKRFGRVLADRYTVAQLERVSANAIIQFQDSYDSMFRGQDYFELCPRNDFIDVHWLNVMFSKEDSVSCLRFKTFPVNLWSALRKEHALNMVSDTFSDVRPVLASRLSPRFVSGITADQVVFLPCQSFSDLELSNFNKEGALQRVTPKQISAYIRSHQVRLSPQTCSWIAYLGDQQRAMLNMDLSSCRKNDRASTVNFAETDGQDCPAYIPGVFPDPVSPITPGSAPTPGFSPASPGSAPTPGSPPNAGGFPTPAPSQRSAPTPAPSQRSAPTPGNSPTGGSPPTGSSQDNPNGGPNTGATVAIVLCVLVTLGVGGFFAFRYYRARSVRGNYTTLI